MSKMNLSYIGVSQSQTKKAPELILTFSDGFGISALFPDGLPANEVALKLHEVARRIEDEIKAQHENPRT